LTVNNKTYSATKVSPFIANYGRELRIGTDIKRKEKVEKGNKIYGKNKKYSRESRDSIKESLEENETTSR